MFRPIAAPLALRHERVLEHLERERLDAAVVHDASNLRWLTGFRGSTGLAIVRPHGVTLVVDGRYGDQARADVAGLADHGVGVEVVEIRTGVERLDRLALATLGTRRVGFEAERLSVAEHQRWSERIPGDLVPVNGIFEQARRIKDEGEISAIAEACRLADLALAEVVPLLVQRVTECDLRDELEHRMRRLGAQGPSYPTIVASGPVHASRPHHQPTRQIIDEGHTLVIDVGALVDGYHSDMTRTFIVGAPTPLQTEVYEVVAAAQRAGLAAVGCGVPVAELDAACRRVVEASGFGPWFAHGASHGVGLDIHEQPFSTPSTRHGDGTFLCGDVITVEPGVYRGDLGGVRIEDLVVLTADGPRVLTTSPKDTPCLPSPPTI